MQKALLGCESSVGGVPRRPALPKELSTLHNAYFDQLPAGAHLEPPIRETRLTSMQSARSKEAGVTGFGIHGISG